MLTLYNSLGRRRQDFEPIESGHVRMYVCGPTVYNYAHIGNARPYVVIDILARVLRRSYRLTYVRNITDVDDKINAAAKAESVSIGTLTARFTEVFHADMQSLGVLPPDIEPRVTEHIAEIQSMIAELIRVGSAYEAEGHVLFSVASFAGYGKLSGRSLKDMLAGARVEVAPYKKDPADFVLWKPSADDEVGWDSRWGRGRPGWHIECSTMADCHLGATIDIHGGGQDLIFPHHENERAQSVCAHDGADFARFWIHNGLVNVDSEKMSKSLGNMLLIRDQLASHPGEVIRLGLLSAHYRQPLDWSPQLVSDAKRRVDRMYGALRDAGIEGAASEPPDEPPARVIEALEDDLNTPQALAELAALVKETNRAPDPAARRAKAAELRSGAWMLGLLQQDPVKWFAQAASAGDADGPCDAEIDAMVKRREALRAAAQYSEADQVRDELDALGIVIEDGAGGSRWRRG